MAVTFDDFSVDLAAREVRRGDRVVNMEPRSYELLAYLLEHRDRAVGKDELQD
jgi:DNA-binding winged helix-turn-helix (wHTH) protein